MKPISSLLACAAFAAATVSLHAADSKRTAEYLLITPSEHENQKVTVDVAFVRPVRFVSPIPGILFFSAMTIDRVDRKPGGEILVAVAEADAEKFAKKYGTDFEGRTEMDTLNGTFLAAGEKRGGIWVIDTTGKLAELIATRKVTFPEEARMGGPGMGGPGMGGPGMGGPGMGEGHRPKRPLAP